MSELPPGDRLHQRPLMRRIAAGDSYGIVLILIVLALGVVTPDTAPVLGLWAVVQAITLLVTFNATLVSAA